MESRSRRLLLERSNTDAAINARSQPPNLCADESLFGNYFVAAYPPFSCWSEKGVEACESNLARAPDASNQVPLGLYVHIPFCAKRCDFCYYLSFADKNAKQIDAYIEALLAEAALWAGRAILKNRRPDFIYFGGGTPSLLSADRIRRLIEGLEAVFSWTNAREITFECAPRTVSAAKLSALRDAGITRLSLGVQQLDDEVLRRNGRIHLVSDVERAYAAIRRTGFDVVNIDLMVGMVGESAESFHDSIDGILQMTPESVTIYQLEIPFNTPLSRALRDGTVPFSLPTWSEKRSRLAEGFARLEEAGYTLRSAYTAVRDPVAHRFIYQDAQYFGADLLGLGVSSFSYLGGVHHQNLASFDPYLDQVRNGSLPIERAYALNEEERLIREFVLQLKLGAVEASYFRDKFGVDVSQRFVEPLTRLAAKGWLTFDQEGVTLTRDGLLRVDHLIPAFSEEGP